MLISTEQMQQQLHASKQVIVDCRFSLADANAGERAYGEAHLPGAVYANLDKDLSSAITSESGRHPLPDPIQFMHRLGEWGIERDMQVIVYDDMNGAFALRLWWLLKWLGHENVSLLDGGWNKWQKEQRPVTSEITHNQAVQYTARTDDSRSLSTEQVQNQLSAEQVCLIDARAPARFAGKEEPIDPVAGHVPGAVNRPFQRNLDESGCFLPAEVLREQFTELLGDYSPAEVAHMCGSGVTACHNLFAMELAGLPGSKLYVGSWSEWIRNKHRSIATDS